ncbi:alginate lyase family protein [uncultured Dokdonia sp.]|uniref:alginate lyase family protein n=1 Tax=uncultured Dokdonia sp. TaxID=575653 RepID=UPI0026251D5B|nr:alginate lyase family protein [uncultured Dokdonia sp.]
MLRSFVYKHPKRIAVKNPEQALIWSPILYCAPSYVENDSFAFLNKKLSITNGIQWNYADYGKLWTYNLNYFDFLSQEDISKDTGLHLIRNYITNENSLKDGLEPYPISLRVINWIKFIGQHEIENLDINTSLDWYTRVLLKHLEYHILGNHLLENGFALYFASYHFKNEKWLKIATTILTKELQEQTLKDGAHFEQSPMYHKIILSRVLDCIYLGTQNDWEKDTLKDTLRTTASKMLSWLSEITFNNGEIPYVNDSAKGITFSSEELFKFARLLKIDWSTVTLNDSGYRMIRKPSYELFLDIGTIAATYQPGHLHADALQFLLNYKNSPVFVDTGVSTYDKTPLRTKERSTSSHNTVETTDGNQYQVWGGFRVAKRSKVTIKEENDSHIIAQLKHFKSSIHHRTYTWDDTHISIKDVVTSKDNKGTASFHLHPDVIVSKISESSVRINDSTINFEGDAIALRIEEYGFAYEYNDIISSSKIIVTFANHLNSVISL